MTATASRLGLGKIRQIAVNVHDLDRATAFYQEILGMPLLFRVPGMSFFYCDGIRLMLGIPEASLRREYRRRIWGLWRARRDPGLPQIYVIKCAIHFHLHTLARQMAEDRGPFRNSF